MSLIVATFQLQSEIFRLFFDYIVPSVFDQIFPISCTGVLLPLLQVVLLQLTLQFGPE